MPFPTGVFDLIVRVDIRDRSQGGSGSLALTSDTTVTAHSFEDVAKIMSKFHELFEQIKASQPIASSLK